MKKLILLLIILFSVNCFAGDSGYMFGSVVKRSGDNAYYDSGNLGIGTDSPSTKIHAYDLTSDIRLTLETDKTNGIAALRYTNDAKSYSTRINASDMFDIRDVTANAARLTIDTTGLIGIGRTPTALLDIYRDQNGRTGLYIDNPNAGNSAESVIRTSSDSSVMTIGSWSAAYIVPPFAGRSGLAVSDGSNMVIGNVNIGSGAGDILFSDLSTIFLTIKTSDASGDVTFSGDSIIKSLGTTGGISEQVGEATATLSGASTTIQVNVPTNARIKGCQLQVETAITSGDGATSWSAAYSGGATQAICSGQAFTLNTEVGKWFDVNTDTDIASGEVDIAITPNANTFSGGVIRAIVYYESFVAMTDI